MYLGQLCKANTLYDRSIEKYADMVDVDECIPHVKYCASVKLGVLKTLGECVVAVDNTLFNYECQCLRPNQR